MGEYAKRSSDGQVIKIGTCESMTDLRPDQLDQVEKVPNSLDVQSPAVNPHLRFRFPFPDEDGTEPGAFADYDRTVAIPGHKVPEDAKHRGSCVDDGTDTVHLVAQRAWEGVLATTMKCGGCRTMWSSTTLEDVEETLSAIRWRVRRAETWEDAAWWAQVGQRVHAGYTNPPAWAATTAPRAAAA